MRTRFYPVLLLAWLLVGGCEKNNPEPQLPPETQEGKNTFGCKVNGEIWLPKSSDAISIGRLPSLVLSYDPDFANGTFQLSAFRRLNEEDVQNINIFSDSLSREGIYSLNKLTRQAVSYFDYKINCLYFTSDNDVNRQGTLTITKFDLNKGIIAGRFEFTLTRNDGCKIIEVTEGRFDMKL